MAGKMLSRDSALLALAGVMAVGLVVALAAGMLAIARIDQPEAASATFVAEAFAWLFAAAFFTAFFLTVSESLHRQRAGHWSAPDRRDG